MNPPNHGDQRKDLTKLFIRNLGYEVDERRLGAIVEQNGPRPLDIYVVKDRESGRSKGYGYVKFRDERDAKDAKARLDGVRIDGRSIYTDYANMRF